MTSLGCSEQAGVVTLCLQRPDVKNAVDESLMAALDEHIGLLEQRDDLVAVILTAEGGESFCSGGDLKWMKGFDTPAKGQAMSRRMQGILHRLAGLSVPVIGVVNGYAYGGGTEVALACDMRVFEEHAFLCFKQARMGVMTGWGGGGRLVHLVGYARALEFVTTCRRVEAPEALTLGLANAVVPRGEGLAEAHRLADKMRKASPIAVSTSKRLLRAAGNLDAVAAAQVEAELFGEVWRSSFHDEALSAFFEKREPRFRDS